MTKKKILELAAIFDAEFCHYNLISVRDQLEVFINDVRNNPKFTNCHDIGDLFFYGKTMGEFPIVNFMKKQSNKYNRRLLTKHRGKKNIQGKT